MYESDKQHSISIVSELTTVSESFNQIREALANFSTQIEKTGNYTAAMYASEASVLISVAGDLVRQCSLLLMARPISVSPPRPPQQGKTDDN